LAGFAHLIDELTAAMRTLSAADLVDEILRSTGYEAHIRAETKEESLRARRLENIAELAAWFRAMGRNGGRAGDLAAQLALLTNADRDESGNAVRLMTLHSAKGLEFQFVYLIGVEQGTLPHAASIDEGRLDEERRLFYVGITRAKERLCLAYAARSRRYGEIVANEPSRFLAELPQGDLHWDGRDAEQDAQVKHETAAAHIARLARMFAQ
ncbi:MAG: ATP-binding domain-containing protein, partial [Proteobacteria bacterium]|nr:ATP-binding domain-containing protein [Pseudomonadota bacterium]